METLPIATSLSRLTAGVWVWSAFSPHHKVELTSHAVLWRDRLFIIDPIPLAPGLQAMLPLTTREAYVLATSGNHERASLAWQQQLGATLITPQQLKPGREWLGWKVHSLSGGGPGEIALENPEWNWVFVGDAIFNLPPWGLSILPDKYCADPSLLRAQLRSLLAVNFQRASFAHGRDLMSHAAASIRTLLSVF